MAKVIETTVSENEISSTIDLELDGVPDRLKPRVKREVGEFLVEQTLLKMGEAKSPVTGKAFKKLNKDYAKEKKAAGRSPVPDLEFTGDMKDDLKFRTTSEGVKIGVFGDDAPKADGHNNFSGKSTLPKRQFLPDEKKSYTRDIRDEVDRIIQDAVVDAKPIAESKLRKIETKDQFWQLLTLTYEGLTKREIIGAVSRNESFVNTLTALGLLKWLK